MELPLKRILTLTAASVITVGLSACSSSPAPWTQANDSPWQSKRDAEAGSADTPARDTYSDPVLLADPEPLPEPIVEPMAEPMMEPERVVMEAPEAAPSPEVIVPVMVEDSMAEAPSGMSSEQDVMNMSGSYFAVQSYASKSAESAEKFIADAGLDGSQVVKTDRNGEAIFVVVDIHPDRATATAAAADIEAKTGSKPWVRSIAGLQKIVMQ